MMLKNAVEKFSKIACTLPEELVRTLACGAGLLACRLWKSERVRIHETIDRVYHRFEKKPPFPIDAIISKVFVHFSMNLLEILRYPVLDSKYLERNFTFFGLEHFEKAIGERKGVILTVPHLGNWELLGAALAHRGYPLHSFYLAQKEDDFGSLLDYFRSYSGIILHDRDRGAVSALKSLKKGAVLGMISDQDGGNQAVYGDFLRHWVAIPAGPANWSLKTGAALIPLYCLRQGNSSKFKAWFFPPLTNIETGTNEQKVVNRTIRIIRWMENMILEHPHQYLWFYDRFKPRHEGHIARLKKSGLEMRHGVPVYGI